MLLFCKWKYKILLLAVMMAWVGCSKEDTEEISPIPAIQFLSISPESVVEFTDPVTIRISYTDGDGDLGENEPEVKNLFVMDNRNQVTFQFRIPELAPEGAKIAITGELPIELSSVAILEENADQEPVIYTVWVVDRAGNQSNQIDTDPITVIQAD